MPEHQIVTLEEILPPRPSWWSLLCEDIETAGNGMMDYVTSLTRNLCETNKTNPDGTISETSTHASWFQSQIHSVHFYPFVTVIEKNYSPVEEFPLEKHGTQWKPWVFYQGQFMDAAARESRRPAPADQGGVGLTARNP